jgi:ATP-dependent DNA helicase HFM1/MER3
LEKLVEIVAACHEFSGMKLRVSEKKNLNLLNKARDHECIRFPLPTRIMTTEMKINCLIQAFLGCLPIHESSLKQDVLRIMWIGKRVTNALAQYLFQHPYYQALVSAITLAKCFHCKLWENSPHMSRQLRGIGAALSSMLAVSNKTSFHSIIESNPRDLESILNRPPPTGDNLKAEVNHLPHFELKAEIITNVSVTELHIYVEMTNRALVQEYNTAGKNHWICLIVGDSNNKCIYKERFKDIRLLEHTEHWTVEIKNPLSVNEVYVNLISEQWVGLDVCSSLKLHQPTHTIPVQVKNSIEKYLRKQGVDNFSRPSISSTPQTIKRTKSSIVDQIKEMSEKRLGNMTPTKLTLNKMAHMPAKKTKLSASLDQLRSTEDAKTDELPQFSSSDRHPTEQVNHETNSRHIKTNLIIEKQVYNVHKYSGLKQDAISTNTNKQLQTLLQDGTTNSPEHLQMQMKQCTVAKCTIYPAKENNSELQDSGNYQSAGTQSIPSLKPRARSKYEMQTTQEPNSNVERTKLSEKGMSSHETHCMLTKPSAFRLMEDCHKTFKENAELNDSSTLEDKPFEKEMDKTLLSQVTISKSQLRNSDTKQHATSSSQFTENSNLQNDSLMEECNYEGSETKEHNFQNGNHCEYMHETTLSLDTHCDNCEQYLQTEMLQTNIPNSGKGWAVQDNSVTPLDDAEPEQSCFRDEHCTKNDSAFTCDSRAVDSPYPSVNTEQSVTNVQQNVYSPHTKERKRLIFQKTLPKHYYPIFMKSLQSDTAGTKQLHSTNCDGLSQQINETALLPLTKEKVPLNSKMSVSDDNTTHNYNTQAEDSETFMAVVKQLHTLPEKESNFNITAEMRNETSVFKLPVLQQSSEKEKQDSLTSENELQVHEHTSTRNEKGDRASELQKAHPIPNFSLVKDFDSFLANMLDADNAEFKCTNQSNKKLNDNFMANAPASITNLARNKPLSHGFQHNHDEYLHRITRNDSKYESVLKLLLKDVSREATSTSTEIRANKDYETKVHQLSSQLQFQPKSQMNYFNLGAKNKIPLLHSSQKPLCHDSNTMLNQNSQHTTPFRKSTQILCGNSSQNDTCDEKYITSEFNYQPSIQKGLAEPMCERDTMPEAMNRISQRNETFESWDTTPINIHTEQSPSRQKRSYTQFFEFENLPSTKSCTLPFTDIAVKTAALHKSTNNANRNNRRSPNSNSQWQKYELSPKNSDQSFELYYHPSWIRDM